MHQPKASKRETPDNNKFTIHTRTKDPNPTSCLVKKRDLIVVSADPATDNFGFAIEQWFSDGRVITLGFEKVKFDREILESGSSILYNQIYDFLDKYKSIYPKCDLFIIERQMAINYKATRVAQTVFSYYIGVSRLMSTNVLTIEIDPKIKGKILGAPKGCSKKELKAWGVELCINLFKLRGDTEGNRILHSYGKKMDDLADTRIQILAFLISIGSEIAIYHFEMLKQMMKQMLASSYLLSQHPLSSSYPLHPSYVLPPPTYSLPPSTYSSAHSPRYQSSTYSHSQREPPPQYYPSLFDFASSSHQSVYTPVTYFSTPPTNGILLIMED
jgi:hypothetical protein